MDARTPRRQLKRGLPSIIALLIPALAACGGGAATSTSKGSSEQQKTYPRTPSAVVNAYLSAADLKELCSYRTAKNVKQFGCGDDLRDDLTLDGQAFSEQVDADHRKAEVLVDPPDGQRRSFELVKEDGRWKVESVLEVGS